MGAVVGCAVGEGDVDEADGGADGCRIGADVGVDEVGAGDGWHVGAGDGGSETTMVIVGTDEGVKVGVAAGVSMGATTDGAVDGARLVGTTESVGGTNSSLKRPMSPHPTVALKLKRTTTEGCPPHRQPRAAPHTAATRGRV